MHRTGTSGAEQAAGAAAPWTESSRDRGRAGTKERSIRGESSMRSRRHLDWIIQGQVAADGPDWNVRGRASSRSRRPPDWSIQGQAAEDAPYRIIRGKATRRGHNPQDRISRGKVARRPGQDRPGRIKQEEPLPPRHFRKQHKRPRKGGAQKQGRG